MKLFNTLMSKIFGHGTTPPVAATTFGGGAPASGGMPAVNVPQPSTQFGGGTATAVATAPVVDVDAVLSDMASKNSEHLDWKTSIVDLMKLVGMDSSLQNRKELATELGYTGDMSDSATMNIWLHKQVLRKLSENGGKVPQNLLD